MDKDIRVRKIKNGTVIDHIASGQALNVLKIIGIPKGYPEATVTVGMNVPSPKEGFKDLIKVEGKELGKGEVDRIALISPKASINIIREYEVVVKKAVSIPDTITGILRCSNPNCISNFEDRTEFRVEEKGPIKLRCKFCERTMDKGDIVTQF